MLYRFLKEINVGDRAVTYDSSRRTYLVGEVTGEYEYARDVLDKYPNIRKVKWLGEIPRDDLLIGTKNSLGAISTLPGAKSVIRKGSGASLPIKRSWLGIKPASISSGSKTNPLPISVICRNRESWPKRSPRILNRSSTASGKC